MISPLLYLGIDIAYRRDTAAVAIVYLDAETSRYCLWDHRIWQPPVHIPDVTEAVLRVLRGYRVAGVLFDPFQYVGESQRLAKEGYGRILVEVNQSSEMVEVGNNLHTHMQRSDFYLYNNDEILSQFSWCAARATERGYRIVKSQQSKPVDIVVAIAMALWGATRDVAGIAQPAYDDEAHAVALEDMP